jgi:chorismate mutase
MDSTFVLMQPGLAPIEKPGRRTQDEDEMTLEELREQIDVLDRKLVELLSERARAAKMIGHLKAATSLPVYEPAREKVIYSNVRAANKGPLPDIELTHIYERIIDVMRALQRDELASERNAQASTSGQGTGAELPQRQRPVAGDPSETPEIGKKQ